MKYTWQILLLSILLFLSSCISQFVPQTNEDKELLVVEGLITDKPGVNTIKLSKTLPLGKANTSNPVKGCLVTISDDLGNSYVLRESDAGIYVTDPSAFQGSVGRFYTLHINTNAAGNNHNYESYPVEMKPVPGVDSVYFEKVVIDPGSNVSSGKDGCQVYLNTYDPTSQCKYYRWEFVETWEFILPYTVPNKICWISANSDVINIKNTSVFAEDRIERYPLNYISNETDRLRVEYSILVNQYSLNEDEYNYWEKLENLSEQVGGLYDMIPSAVPSNIYSTDDPTEKVQGYFSVSATSSKRIFIKDHFAGVVTPYTDEACIADTIFAGTPIPDYSWVIIDHPLPPPSYKVTTRTKVCYDCTVRGTNIQPDFWPEGK